MIRRSLRFDRLGSMSGAISPVVRAAATTLVVALPLIVSAPAAGAQDTPPSDPASVGISDATVVTALESIGTVTIKDHRSVGWIGGSGLVLTSDSVASEVGVAARFAVQGSSHSDSCYVALHFPEKRLSVLRCAELRGRALGIETKYPEPGAPVVAVALQRDDQKSLVTQGGTITANDVQFMHSNRLRFSMTTETADSETDAQILDAENVAGVPVVNAEGKVVSTLLASPADGGTPIGIIPSDLTKAINKGLPLPGSFSSAAIIAVGKRAIIPALIGLVIGLVWALFARRGSMLNKVIGLAAVGVVGAVLYSAFTVMIVGPQTLIG